MIDLEQEKALPLAKAAKLVPPARSGKKTHASTLFRWITSGVGGVRLEGLRLGGRWFTSKEALQRFAAALTPAAEGPAPDPPRSPVGRRRASERAERELEKLGI